MKRMTKLELEAEAKRLREKADVASTIAEYLEATGARNLAEVGGLGDLPDDQDDWTEADWQRLLEEIELAILRQPAQGRG
jgi:hypothetical protein